MLIRGLAERHVKEAEQRDYSMAPEMIMNTMQISPEGLDNARKVTSSSYYM